MKTLFCSYYINFFFFNSVWYKFKAFWFSWALKQRKYIEKETRKNFENFVKEKYQNFHAEFNIRLNCLMKVMEINGTAIPQLKTSLNGSFMHK